MPANLENSAVATGLEKVSFHSNLKERQCKRIYKVESYKIKIQVFFKSCFLLFLRETSSKSSMKGEHQPWQSVSDRESTAFIRMKSIPKYETILPAASYYLTVALNHNQKKFPFSISLIQGTPNGAGRSKREGIYVYTFAQSLQSCLTLCDPRDGSPPGFSVPGILQATILEWVAMPSSRDLPDPGQNPSLLCLQHCRAT